MIDIFRDRWTAMFPSDQPYVSGGLIPLFNDRRIAWLVERCGGNLAGLTVAELGPLEGGHSYMLQNAGAARVHAVEGNTLNVVKTLIVKDVFGLDRLDLECGEIEGWLTTTSATYDMVLASGVLYHFNDPLQALHDITRMAPRIFLWTHFMHDEFMPWGDLRLSAFDGETRERSVAGYSCLYYARSYDGAESQSSFCGGISTKSIWIGYDAILGALQHWGFDVEVAMLEPDHANGPCACFFAQRREDALV